MLRFACYWCDTLLENSIINERELPSKLESVAEMIQTKMGGTLPSEGGFVVSWNDPALEPESEPSSEEMDKSHTPEFWPPVLEEDREAKAVASYLLLQGDGRFGINGQPMSPPEDDDDDVNNCIVCEEDENGNV